jgi:hypothetical protein
MNDIIKIWHERARPHPTEDNLAVQFGCHIEEFIEGLDSVSFAFLDEDAEDYATMMFTLEKLANGLKKGVVKMQIDNRKELLDSLADQVVTGVGVGHCAKMNIVEAINRVNSSNWSKYNADGKPIFDEHGKIAKGPNYAPPDLKGLY